MKNMKKLLTMTSVLSLLLIGLISCKKENTPTSALKGYVNSYFNGDDTKDYLLKNTTGNMKLRLEGFTEDQWKDFLLKEPIKKKSLKILLENCVNEAKCFITYSFSYKSDKKVKNGYLVETKKIAELHKESDYWKIANVSNVKTYLEGSSAIEVMAQ
jgi:hypothetical protein